MPLNAREARSAATGCALVFVLAAVLCSVQAADDRSAQEALELMQAHLERLQELVPDAPERGGAELALPAVRARLIALRGPRPEDDPLYRFSREAVLTAAVEQAGARTLDCCPCASAATCDDERFCNGSEFCNSGVCAAGVAPTCDDADPCTEDACETGTDACGWTPLPPPAPVSLLLLEKTAPASSTAALRWSDSAGNPTYNLYRGRMADLGDLACFLSDLPESEATDDGMMSPTGLDVYLVTAEECGESGLGDNSFAPRDPPADVCP